MKSEGEGTLPDPIEEERDKRTFEHLISSLRVVSSLVGDPVSYIRDHSWQGTLGDYDPFRNQPAARNLSESDPSRGQLFDGRPRGVEEASP